MNDELFEKTTMYDSEQLVELLKRQAKENNTTFEHELMTLFNHLENLHPELAFELRVWIGLRRKGHKARE